MNFLQWLKQVFASDPITCKPSDDVGALVLSILLTVGMFLSYLPQVGGTTGSTASSLSTDIIPVCLYLSVSLHRALLCALLECVSISSIPIYILHVHVFGTRCPPPSRFPPPPLG